MRKKVCMFVWNHFTNDARVLRECTALSEDKYSVDLICIHDPTDQGLPRFEERNPNFRVYRVRRYPVILEVLQKFYRLCIKNKLIGSIALVLWSVSMYNSPLITGLVSIMAFLMLKTKLKVMVIRGGILFRMILHGLKNHYDIYHSNDLNTLPQGFICAKIRFKQKKLVYDSHEVQTSRTGYDSKIYGILEGFYIKQIDTMIVENHTRAKYNEDLYGFYPEVIHNYPFKQNNENNKELAPLHQLLGIDKDEKILLYQGGIQTGRGLENLVQAAPFFNEGTLVFIGDGKIKPKLQRMVNEMGLEEKVKFLSKVPVLELPNYTRNAYLGFQVLNNVCFNHYSASSNKLFEYMMASVPVVACDFPEIKRVVEGEQVGLCIDSHNHEEIAEAVNTLLTNKELYLTCQQNTLSARDKYNWENEKINLLSIYNEYVGV
ncbi:glycosyltransferase [Bacillus pinisoli]|uniref:glycosyltransferase n=1 Tax=Bacillus pinisoli TaxID=2901866 RepID=UPI001FF137A6|nr:glycosyltransferase [Bacillus pinisoli]